MITITIISIISTLSIITLICLFRWFWAFRTLWMVTLAISDHDSQRVSSGLSHGSFCLPGETAWCSFSSSRIWESSSTSGWLYLHICIYIYMYICIYIYMYILYKYIYIYTNMQHVCYIYIYLYYALLLTQGILVDVMTIYMTGKSWNCLKPARSAPHSFKGFATMGIF